MSLTEREWAMLCLELLEDSIILNEEEFSRDRAYMIKHYPLYKKAMEYISDGFFDVDEYINGFRKCESLSSVGRKSLSQSQKDLLNRYFKYEE